MNRDTFPVTVDGRVITDSDAGSGGCHDNAAAFVVLDSIAGDRGRAFDVDAGIITRAA